MNQQDTENNENHDVSKRRFLSTAVKIAYIAPVVMSLPANAHVRNCGSNQSSYSTNTYSSNNYDEGEHNYRHRH